MHLHLSIAVRDCVAAEDFISAVLEIVGEAELHPGLLSQAAVVFVDLATEFRLFVVDVEAGLVPGFSLFRACFAREKSRLHSFLEKTELLTKISNHYPYSPSKILCVSHPKSKPLQTTRTIRIGPHKNVVLTRRDATDSIAVGTLKISVELDLDFFSGAFSFGAFLQLSGRLFLVFVMLYSDHHFCDLGGVGREQRLLAPREDHVLGNGVRPPQLRVPDVLPAFFRLRRAN